MLQAQLTNTGMSSKRKNSRVGPIKTSVDESFSYCYCSTDWYLPSGLDECWLNDQIQVLVTDPHPGGAGESLAACGLKKCIFVRWNPSILKRSKMWSISEKCICVCWSWYQLFRFFGWEPWFYILYFVTPYVFAIGVIRADSIRSERLCPIRRYLIINLPAIN